MKEFLIYVIVNVFLTFFYIGIIGLVIMIIKDFIKSWKNNEDPFGNGGLPPPLNRMFF